MIDTSIIVNGRPRVVTTKTVSYEDVVRLAYENPPQHLLTLTFYRGPFRKSEGSLTPGESINVKDGMVFNVSDTYRS
jgi:hypothetical protein